MAYLAHVRRNAAQILVADDRGTPATQLELPASPHSGVDADEALLSAGWARTSDWSETDEGWQAPVMKRHGS